MLDIRDKGRAWFDLARADLEASKILNKYKFYPQSLYFLHQSAEKFGKGIALSINIIKSPKEASHDLGFSLYKGVEKQFNVELTKSDSETLDPDQTEKLHSLLSTILTLKRKKFVNVPEVVEHGLSKLDKELIELAKEKEDVKNVFVKVPDNLHQLTSEQKELVTLSLNKAKQYKFNKTSYAIGVLYFFGSVMPDEQSFRYPEFKPIATYSEAHILVKEYDRISKHLEIAIENFISLYQEDVFRGLHEP